MKNILRQICNKFIHFFQLILCKLLILYIIIFVVNFGFRSKSKTFTRYLLYAFKYKKTSNKKILRDKYSTKRKKK